MNLEILKTDLPIIIQGLKTAFCAFIASCLFHIYFFSLNISYYVLVWMPYWTYLFRKASCFLNEEILSKGISLHKISYRRMIYSSVLCFMIFLQ